jgi:hypothetical protein
MGGVYLVGVWAVLQGAGCTMTANRPIFTAAKQGGGTSQPKHHDHGSLNAKDEGATRLLMGRGGGDCHLHLEQIIDTRR